MRLPPVDGIHARDGRPVGDDPQSPQLDKAGVERFYDNWVRRLLTDYVAGNERAEAAIAFAVSSLPAGNIRVLDVGCGIGWSSFEVVRNHPNATVHGVDLSPRLIAVAEALFGTEAKLSFQSADVLDGGLADSEFDAILLLDVYEHLPAAARDAVAGSLRTLLNGNGRLIITTPTVALQEYIRSERPHELQPIDEDVSPENMERLAEAVDGRVLERRVVSIWRQDDYMYTVIAQGEARDSHGHSHLERPSFRADRVQRQLGLRWTSSVGFVSARGTTDICVGTRRLPPHATFVHQHVEKLPARIHVSSEALLPSWLARVVRTVARRAGKDPHGVEERVAMMLTDAVRSRRYQRFFRRKNIRVVLGEWGPMAVELRRACRRAGIPLVAHFHGFDAFKTDTLDQNAAEYRAVFEQGWPVVAVSESMKSQLVSLGADPRQVRVIRYGVDLSSFVPGEPVPGLVVMVGRLVEKKGPEFAVRAFARAAADVPDARLVIIGDGPLRARVQQLVFELGLEDRVRLDGARDHGWVTEVLRTASVFIQHSVVADDGDREGTPVAVVEAGAAGVPVVATRHEGIAEVVVDGVTGLLVDEGDVEGMGRAIAELLSDPARARRMGASSRRRIEQFHSDADTIEQLWSVLEDAVAGRYP